MALIAALRRGLGDHAPGRASLSGDAACDPRDRPAALMCVTAGAASFYALTTAVLAHRSEKRRWYSEKIEKMSTRAPKGTKLNTD